jgi:hypothetical protein
MLWGVATGNYIDNHRGIQIDLVGYQMIESGSSSDGGETTVGKKHDTSDRSERGREHE